MMPLPQQQHQQHHTQKTHQQFCNSQRKFGGLSVRQSSNQSAWPRTPVAPWRTAFTSHQKATATSTTGHVFKADKALIQTALLVVLCSTEEGGGTGKHNKSHVAALWHTHGRTSDGEGMRPPSKRYIRANNSSVMPAMQVMHSSKCESPSHCRQGSCGNLGFISASP